MDRDRAKQIENVQASAGCLARIFTLIGLFWLGSVIVTSINAYQSGGDFGITGSIIPALAFLFAARVIRRRATQVGATLPSGGGKTPKAESGSAASKKSESGESPSAPSPATNKPKAKKPDMSAPSVQEATPPRPRSVVPPPQDPPRPRSQPSPEPSAQPPGLPSSDTGKPLTSEEMIKRAKARYMRDEDGDS